VYNPKIRTPICCKAKAPGTAAYPPSDQPVTVATGSSSLHPFVSLLMYSLVANQPYTISRNEQT
jgi:hypothetical protein